MILKKHNIRFSLVCFLCVTYAVTTGCATARKTFTQEEWTQITTREFKGKSVNEVLNAAERVLLLADESDVKVYKWPNRLIGERNASVYFVIGFFSAVYTFDLQLEQKEDRVKAILLSTIATGGMYGAIYQTPVGYNPMIITAPSVGGAINDNPEIYHLFFSRIESLLYGEKWVSCNDAKDIFTDRRIGALEAVCLVADDKSPFDDVNKKEE